MKWLLGVAVLACGTACGSGGDASTGSEKDDTFSVTVVVRANDLSSIRYQQDADRCVAQGNLGTVLGVNKESVVISDPAGREVALGKFARTDYETYIDPDDGEEYVSPGVCSFEADVADVDLASGVYTVSVPDLGIKKRFTPQSGTNSVKIRYDAG